jgi:hypothetical protein
MRCATLLQMVGNWGVILGGLALIRNRSPGASAS